MKAMLFLATPHAGSSHSKVLNKLLGIVPSKGRQQYVRDLNISSATIRTIDELFRGTMGDLILASLYEVFPLKIAPLYNKVESRSLGIAGGLSVWRNSIGADFHYR